MNHQRYATRIRLLVELGAAAFVIASTYAVVTSAQPGWEILATQFILLVTAVAITRRLGIALPGRGFASFVLGAVLVAMLLRGWTFAVLVGLVGMPIGDVLLRRVPLREAFTLIEGENGGGA